MLSSLHAIAELKSGNTLILREHKWLKYLSLTKEKNVNLEQVDSLEQMAQNPVLEYVERTLQVLDGLSLHLEEKELVEEVLIWSETAKCGLPHQRREWLDHGFHLAIHNIGSAQIYASEMEKRPETKRNREREKLLYVMILTHGLAGQYIRGEVRYSSMKPLIEVATGEMFPLLYALNQCIVAGVSPGIWSSVQKEMEEVNRWICDGEMFKVQTFQERLRRLRNLASLRGENFDAVYDEWLSPTPDAETLLVRFFRETDMWYVEASLTDFTFEECIKIFLLIERQTREGALEQLSFEPMMKELYYDFKGRKTVNVYKKRIIESYLAECTIEEIVQGKHPANEHVQLMAAPLHEQEEMAGVGFSFSRAGEKLIEFCQEAEKSPLYDRAIVLLFDLFNFRKDAYDRLNNEQTYLSDMNSSQDFKKKISDYAVGEPMVDIGPGGGVMLDLLTRHHPGATVIGIDIAVNVVEELKRKKQRDNAPWEVMQGDALKLEDYIGKEGADTIVFSSILHEMFSYIPYEGEKFNHGVIAQTLKSSLKALRPKGRIIIRDGIMTEPEEEKRIIRFKDPQGLSFFKRYVGDFKGRSITYRSVGEDAVLINVNDAMEFLYTYTWGEEAYPHEVQEQFGYFTPSGFRGFIQATLGGQAEILVFEHYLQEGYEEHLSRKITLTDEAGIPVRLPDSTCFIVVEKK
ncbi:class I SAM-dependent methyltransferase [Rossellomorea vietnamensis]|uniref:class I SAM-dependent methyltransferase n=1 Tax=Rossellomorea vietnamensis TaxID=218284 RepID=UPI001E467D0E|nr:class I SAM-dependent methyltransferase [Rossellomorea vietnamensis]MCC5804340.1 class I SAM-dependent methyltransferase [Rossellomorea vietnamensis]